MAPLIRLTTLAIMALTIVLSPARAQDAGADAGQDIPPDVDMALAAVVSALRHQPETAPSLVEFAPGVAAAMAEDGFAYDGFQLANVEDITVETSDAPQGQTRRVSGGLIFVDLLQRRAVAGFAVDYRPLPSGGIAVLDGATEVIAPAEPRIALYLIPAAAVPEDVAATAPDQLQLMDWLKGVAWRPGTRTPAEGLAPVAVFLDRLPSEALAFFAVTAPGAKERTRPSTQVVDYGGWRMLMAHDPLGPSTAALRETRLEVLVQPTLGGKPSGAAKTVLDWKLARFLP